MTGHPRLVTLPQCPVRVAEGDAPVTHGTLAARRCNSNRAGAALGTGMGYLLFDTAGSEFESADAGIPPPERPD